MRFPRSLVAATLLAMLSPLIAAPSTRPRTVPADLLSLPNWKLTLPTMVPHAGKPEEITQPALATFEDPTYFHVNDTNDGVAFRAHCGGQTTPGSNYPRSELRQMTDDGKKPASWSTTVGTNSMKIKQAITHLPTKKPHVVAGQIHDANDDVITVRLEGKKLFIDQNGTPGPTLTDVYQLGAVFTVKFAAHDGGVDCFYNDKLIYTYAVKADGCYFKAGCYTQSNVKKGDAADAYGEVVIKELVVKSE